MGKIFSKLLAVLYTRKLDVALVGLENAGKTTLLHRLSGGASVDTVPTVGMNVKSVKRGGVQLKCWDIGGGAALRSEWGRFSRGCDVILYVVDAAAASDVVDSSRRELHRLLEDRELATTPILVVANKIDVEPHLTEEQIIRELNLDYIVENPWVVMSISALKGIAIEQVLEWLIKQSRKR
mmetsp:Transcript_1252/g.3350  ORF Transcript_1252/g.3350 Transcript_1252/m.3350 type:complete len:181 (-) Transcript_1252:204-746(-)